MKAGSAVASATWTGCFVEAARAIGIAETAIRASCQASWQACRGSLPRCVVSRRRTRFARGRVNMPALKNPRHEALAQALARGMSASAAYVEAGYKANRHNAAALAREKHIRTRVTELQE